MLPELEIIVNLPWSPSASLGCPFRTAQRGEGWPPLYPWPCRSRPQGSDREEHSGTSPLKRHSSSGTGLSSSPPGSFLLWLSQFACSLTQSCPSLLDSMDYSPPGGSCPWYFPGKNRGAGCHFSPGALPNARIEPICPVSTALARLDSLQLSHLRSPPMTQGDTLDWCHSSLSISYTFYFNQCYLSPAHIHHHDFIIPLWKPNHGI